MTTIHNKITCESASLDDSFFDIQGQLNLIKNGVLEKLINLSNYPATSMRSEVTGILDPVIKAILDYDTAFTKNCTEASSLIDQVANKDPVAIVKFKSNMADITYNLQRIQGLAQNAQTQLDILREKTAKEISTLAGQIQVLELQQTNLEGEIKFLENEIKELDRQLETLRSQSNAICFISAISCKSLRKKIKNLTEDKNQRQSELSNRTTQIILLNNQLSTLREEHKNLLADFDGSTASLAEIQNVSNQCIYILNNIESILTSLENIDENNPTTLTRRLTALQRDWDDLVNEVKLFRVALAIKS